jgi:hypothetical protein
MSKLPHAEAQPATHRLVRNHANVAAVWQVCGRLCGRLVRSHLPYLGEKPRTVWQVWQLV